MNSNAATCIKDLWQERFFEVGRPLRSVSEGINQKWGHNFSSPEISKALSKAPFLIKSGRQGSYIYKQRTSPVSKRIENIEDQLFSSDLLGKFGTAFKNEVADLHFNFGRSGTCTAFLLRKILEKAIYLAFAKQALQTKLEDRSKPGRLQGLDGMLDTAAREKIANVPILLPKTVEKIKGIKFLGDTSAHNPLANVDMETVIPQMPYIIVAYKELAERL